MIGEFMLQVLAQITFFGGVFALLLAAGRAVQKTTAGLEWLVVLLFLNLGALQLIVGLELFFWEYKWVLGANITGMVSTVLYTLLGPVVFWTFESLGLSSGADEPANRNVLKKIYSHWKHVLPAALIAAIFAGYTWRERANIHTNYFWNESSNAPYLMGVVASLVVIFYIGLLMFRLYRVRPNLGEPDRQRIHLMMFLALFILICGLIELMYGEDWIEAAGTILIVIIFLMENRYPGFLRRIARESRRANYETSRVANLDTEQIIADLRRIMREERLYLNEELALGDLAERSDLTVHQLSEILNVALKTGFYGFINGFRVEHACRLLLEKPELSTTAIGFESGFNANSAFYKAFKQTTGAAPGEYRKQNRPAAS